MGLKTSKELLNGKNIPFDFMIFTGGSIPTDIVKNLDVQHNHFGQIIGDAAEIRNKQNYLIPDTAQVAIKSGHAVSHNIKQLLREQKLHPNRIQIKGLAIALGGKYAIVDLEFIRIYGRAGYYIKKITEKLYKYPLWLRYRYGFRKIGRCNL